MAGLSGAGAKNNMMGHGQTKRNSKRMMRARLIHTFVLLAALAATGTACRTDSDNIEAWGRLGEVCQEYLNKGSLVYLDGRLKTEKYEDKGGETRYFTKVVAQFLQFLSGNRAGDSVIEEVGVMDADELESEIPF